MLFTLEPGASFTGQGSATVCGAFGFFGLCSGARVDLSARFVAGRAVPGDATALYVALSPGTWQLKVEVGESYRVPFPAPCRGGVCWVPLLTTPGTSHGALTGVVRPSTAS